MSSLKPGECKISMARNTVFGNANAPLIVGNLLAMDLTSAFITSIEIPTPQKQETESFTPDSRSVGQIVTLGFEKGESTWEFEMLTGIFLYYAMGECATTGSDPFIHALTESDTLPSFGLHIEQEHGTYPIRVDLLGCMVVSVEVVTEAGGDTPVMLNVEIYTAREIEGADLATPTRLALDKFVRDHMSVFTLKYNALDLETSLKVQCDKHSFKIINEIEYFAVWNDEYPNRVTIGKRTYELMYHVTTENNQKWYNISKLAVPNFTAHYASKAVVTEDIIASGGGTVNIVLTTGLTGVVAANATDYVLVHSGESYVISSYTTATKTLVLAGVGPADDENINIVLATKVDTIASGGTTTSLVLTTGLTGDYLNDIGSNYLVLHGTTLYKIVSYTTSTKTLVLEANGPADAEEIALVKSYYYVGAIAMQTKLARSVNDHVSIACTKLRLDPFKLKFPSWEEKELESDYTLKAAPGNVCTIEVKDALSNLYYEGV